MRTARVIDKSSVQGITNLLEAKVNEMVAGAQKRAAGQADAPLLPLVRLRVDYTGFSTINAQRFGQRFVGKVANPHDLLLFQKAPARKAKVCFYAASCNCLLGVALVMLMLFQAIVKGFRSCCALRSATELQGFSAASAVASLHKQLSLARACSQGCCGSCCQHGPHSAFSNP